MANVFFQATKDALDNITAAFDFVHPLRASMQYTRRSIGWDFYKMKGHFVSEILADRSFIDAIQLRLDDIHIIMRIAAM